MRMLLGIIVACFNLRRYLNTRVNCSNGFDDVGSSETDVEG
jgi:hypothetical protein